MPNKALHLTLIPLRFIRANELGRWATTMRVFISFAVTVIISAYLTAASAEQNLPIEIINGNIVYQSQLNYITAFDTKTKRTIWKTVLYQDLEPDNFNPNMERDVQWTVIERLEIFDESIKATDTKNRIYFISKSTGIVVNHK